MKERVEVWAPATVANMNVGFDALGCALSAPGERMILHRTSGPGVVRIRAIHGAALDDHPERNVASIAAKSLLQSLGNPWVWNWRFSSRFCPGVALVPVRRAQRLQWWA